VRSTNLDSVSKSAGNGTFLLHQGRTCRGKPCCVRGDWPTSIMLGWQIIYDVRHVMCFVCFCRLLWPEMASLKKLDILYQVDISFLVSSLTLLQSHYIKMTLTWNVVEGLSQRAVICVLRARYIHDNFFYLLPLSKRMHAVAVIISTTVMMAHADNWVWLQWKTLLSKWS